MYFRYKNKYFKIPTYGKITKIIDFGRATFKVKNQIFLVMYLRKMVMQKGNTHFLTIIH